MREQSKIKKLKLEGGFRTKEKFHKKLEPGKPLISIITVVYNSEQYLEQTIRSIISQSYKNIEYIIIDGASTDRTLDIVRRFESQIDYWISEPDRSLYEAMNKGSCIACGDYILYINAGDYLYHNDSIEQTIRLGLKGNKKPNLIIGKILYAEKNSLFLDWVFPINESQIYKYNPPHQGTLIAFPIYKKVFYNELFKLGGDGDFWRLLRQNDLFHFKYIDNIISVFRLGGISNNGKKEYAKYLEGEISRYFRNDNFSIIRLIKKYIYAFIKRSMISILGESLYTKYILYNIYRFRRRFSR